MAETSLGADRAARRPEGSLPRPTDEAVRPVRRSTWPTARSRSGCDAADPSSPSRRVRDPARRRGTCPAVYTGAAASPQPRRRPSRRLRRPRRRRHREPDGRDLLYLAGPDAPPLVTVGSVVHPGTIVCIIEAMKVFTDIPAGVSGTIVEVLAKNGQAVEYGQPLFRVTL